MAARINILVMTGSFVKGFFIRYDLENLLGYMALFSTYNQHSQAGDLTSSRDNLIKAPISPEAEPGGVPDAEKFPENPAADLEPVLLGRVGHQLRVHVNLATVHIGHSLSLQ